MGSMKDKVIIITGGASGQGAAEARLFAREGGKVVVTDISEAGHTVAEALGGAGHFVHHDVTDEAGWAKVIDQTLDCFGRLDVLVNNAAIFKPACLRDTDVALMDLHYRVNQLSVYLGMHAAVGAMVKTGGGSIVNVSSLAGMSNTPNIFAYGASKWAVRGMTKMAATELAPLGIRVNGVFPGAIDTPMLKLPGDTPEQRKAFVEANIPMGRLGKSEEVAELVLFLASDASSYVTGSEMTVAGGMG